MPSIAPPPLLPPPTIVYTRKQHVTSSKCQVLHLPMAHCPLSLVLHHGHEQFSLSWTVPYANITHDLKQYSDVQDIRFLLLIVSTLTRIRVTYSSLICCRCSRRQLRMALSLSRCLQDHGLHFLVSTMRTSHSSFIDVANLTICVLYTNLLEYYYYYYWIIFYQTMEGWIQSILGIIIANKFICLKWIFLCFWTKIYLI